jgi:hypothetical protein
MSSHAVINWREKFVAFAIHFVVTAAVGACAAALIFLVWFPHPFATMIGGTGLFLLVVGCDLVLGPVLSLVVYDSRKSRRALVVDYTTIGIVQMVMMIYGVYIVAGARPAVVAFSKDRFEIVAAHDIAEKELAAARVPEYRSLSLTGPRYVSIRISGADYQDALFEALKGNEEHQRPRFYAPYEAALEQMRRNGIRVEVLERKFPAYKPALDAAVRQAGIAPQNARCFPVHNRMGFWTAIVDEAGGKPLSYAAVDPYGPD